MYYEEIKYLQEHGIDIEVRMGKLDDVYYLYRGKEISSRYIDYFKKYVDNLQDMIYDDYEEKILFREPYLIEPKYFHLIRDVYKDFDFCIMEYTPEYSDTDCRHFMYWVEKTIDNQGNKMSSCHCTGPISDLSGDHGLMREITDCIDTISYQHFKRLRGEYEKYKDK